MELKVGDLVELSAYGKKLKCLKDFRGDIGILITTCSVMWSKNPHVKSLVNRRDIKKVRG